jgi:tetratricopeptide (TPR) repeat protein
MTAATFPFEDRGDYLGALGLRCADYHVSPCTTEALGRAVLTTRPDAYAIDRRAEMRPIVVVGLIARAHDTRTAQSLLDRYQPELNGRSPIFIRALQLRRLAEQAVIDRQRQDWAAAVARLQEANSLGNQWEVIYGLGSEDMTPAAELPDALAHAGRLAEAETLIGQTAADCYPCLIVRARVAEMKGDHAGADRWMAAALAAGPSLPQAEWQWGAMLLARGRADEAVVKLAVAARKAPHSADVFETWGEALTAKGDLGAAASKFAQANAEAPSWGRLHLKWAETLAKTGKAGEARAQKQTADGLDLTPAERAELNGLKV